MPQMFPLLWTTLFLITALALFFMVASVHFLGKTLVSSSLMSNISSKDYSWKW